MANLLMDMPMDMAEIKAKRERVEKLAQCLERVNGHALLLLKHTQNMALKLQMMELQGGDARGQQAASLGSDQAEAAEFFQATEACFNEATELFNESQLLCHTPSAAAAPLSPSSPNVNQTHFGRNGAADFASNSSSPTLVGQLGQLSGQPGQLPGNAAPLSSQLGFGRSACDQSGGPLQVAAFPIRRLAATKQQTLPETVQQLLDVLNKNPREDKNPREVVQNGDVDLFRRLIDFARGQGGQGEAAAAAGGGGVGGGGEAGGAGGCWTEVGHERAMLEAEMGELSSWHRLPAGAAPSSPAAGVGVLALAEPPAAADEGKSAPTKKRPHPPPPSLHADGFKWNKHGEKKIKGHPFPRSYFHCAKRAEGCKATKTAQRDKNNPQQWVFHSLHNHNHKKPDPPTVCITIVEDPLPGTANRGLHQQYLPSQYLEGQGSGSVAWGDGEAAEGVEAAGKSEGGEAGPTTAGEVKVEDHGAQRGEYVVLGVMPPQQQPLVVGVDEKPESMMEDNGEVEEESEEGDSGEANMEGGSPGRQADAAEVVEEPLSILVPRSEGFIMRDPSRQSFWRSLNLPTVTPLLDSPHIVIGRNPDLHRFTSADLRDLVNSPANVVLQVAGSFPTPSPIPTPSSQFFPPLFTPRVL